MTVIDVTDVVCQTGNPVTLIGTDKEEVLSAREIASRANTSPYELITRLNPLIERVIL
jgi:alanine racemase